MAGNIVRRGATTTAIALCALFFGLLISIFFIYRAVAPHAQSDFAKYNARTPMKIESPAFQNNGLIPSKYTCDGDNTSPPLRFIDVPSTAKTIALIMDDPDIPEMAKKSYGIEAWDHWTVFNISPNIQEVQEGTNPPGTLGKNTRGSLAYGSPCPPDREHRYFFKLYALSSELPLRAGATKSQVEAAMQGHIIAQVELIGRYDRKR